nr:PIN domain-containing protein [Pseudoxanthomonas sp.]
MKYLLDSVVVIDHLNGHPEATRFISQHAREIAISVITRAEVLAGLPEPTRAVVATLLDRFPNLQITREGADIAAALRHAQRLKLPDAFQAALAISEQLTLVTRNTRDFRSNDMLTVLTPYHLP